MRIDSHHHFWDYTPEAYEWIGHDMSLLKRDFGPESLKPLLDEFGIEGVISVQARTGEAENSFLLDYAKNHDFIRGVVGWLDLTKTDVADKVARFAEADLRGERGRGDRLCIGDDPLTGRRVVKHRRIAHPRGSDEGHGAPDRRKGSTAAYRRNTRRKV